MGKSLKPTCGSFDVFHLVGDVPFLLFQRPSTISSMIPFHSEALSLSTTLTFRSPQERSLVFPRESVGQSVDRVPGPYDQALNLQLKRHPKDIQTSLPSAALLLMIQNGKPGVLRNLMKIGLSKTRGKVSSNSSDRLKKWEVFGQEIS